MRTLTGRLVLGLILVMAACGYAAAHCEIPCGIYDDRARINMMLEDIETVEKSMRLIVELARKGPGHANQLIRWVMNKEQHANKIQEVAAQYFLTQRIKPGAKHYAKKLELLHQVMVYAMKCKQTTDLGQAAKLRSLVKEFSALYFAK